MATIVVQRPKLAWHEKLFISTLYKGLKITVGHALRNIRSVLKGGPNGVTMQYPEQKWDESLPEWYRGAPALVTDEHDRERCVSCQLCEFICPPKAIRIIPGEIPSDDPWAKVEKRPKEFEIDMIRCIYCGMCQEACPVDAIVEGPNQEYAVETREELYYDKDRLLENGARWEREIARNLVVDAPYR